MKSTHICTGILAHVDAGKTTLSEQILYRCGSIRKLGRVDHRDTLLDNDEIERDRGITVFSKQARFSLGDYDVTLLDTPGHMDFSSEMERTLPLLDLAILMVNGAEGVDRHTIQLFKLLGYYGVPAVIFVNKMDQYRHTCAELMDDIKKKLDTSAVYMEDPDRDHYTEEVCSCHEELMERYLNGEDISSESLKDAVSELLYSRGIFPVYFGSALKGEGVDELIKALEKLLRPVEYGDDFGARVYRIARDDRGERLTFMKITGGVLRPRDTVTFRDFSGKSSVNSSDGDDAAEDTVISEKVNQIRLYSGVSFESTDQVVPGQVCGVTGLSGTYAGQSLGADSEAYAPQITPVLSFHIIPEDGWRREDCYKALVELSSEDPLLSVQYDDRGDITAALMGKVQCEILKRIIKSRYGHDISFSSGRVVYRETIKAPVEGVGHFEPLRHYAEVHLLMEPGAPGSGVTASSSLSTDVLAANWQKLVLSHILERRHRGTLTGSELTDVKITLIAGRASNKHTVGGDFRQATYRAIRQGCMKAEMTGNMELLEPFYSLEINLPSDKAGRAMSDIISMHGEAFIAENDEDGMSVVRGSAPVSEIQDYQLKLSEYTAGAGTIQLTFRDYEPCHNKQEVEEQKGYDPDSDMYNPTGSVFCSHGAGIYVPWYDVEQWMHVESPLKETRTDEEKLEEQAELARKEGILRQQRHSEMGGGEMSIGLDEIEEIFQRTYGTTIYTRLRHDSDSASSRNYETPTAKPLYPDRHVRSSSDGRAAREKPKEKYLIVDGYNVIFDWVDQNPGDDLDLMAARNKLADILSNYQSFTGEHVVLVFDAYKIKGGTGSKDKLPPNLDVVYTRGDQTADSYIERLTEKLQGRADVTVATSDGAVQTIAFGHGAKRLSSRELKIRIENTAEQIRALLDKGEEQ